MSLFHSKKQNIKRKNSRSSSSENVISNEPLSGIFTDDLQKIMKTFEKSSDVVVREFSIGKDEMIKAAIVYTDGLADTTSIQNVILESLMMETKQLENSKENVMHEKVFNRVKNCILTIGEIKEITDFEALFTSILSGNTIILIDGFREAISASTAGWEDRVVSEPTSQTVVRGPREGFSENIRTNTALVRRKIKDSNLYCEQKQIGRVTKTNIAVMYIKGIVNDKVVQEVHTRLDRIDIDGILESGYIEELIQDEAYTPFPTIFNSERPDVVAACLLEGRVAILVDGTPFVLIVPSLFIQSFQVAEDYYQRADVSSLLRMLRMICFLIALLGPSFYIAVTTYHQEMLPTPLLISLAAQREGVPFPAFVEAVIMEITFEILREAGIRMPRAVGQAVSIVGALVLGQAAVAAGIVSASMVIVVSITAIANFVFPAYNMAISVRMLRFLMMMLAASFGVYGITIGMLALLLHLNSLRSFGVPYMAPFGPFIPDDVKDTIFRFPQGSLLTRPRLISQKNIKRNANPNKAKPEPRK
ncbi:spore germination protein [Ectobacillus sp. sgz5001026]|uniref:spore germination protein n=1 Tax=Ectobacillus sp. sgz5001026 TaxID=3242473 RepID=UPI0036D2B038